MNVVRWILALMLAALFIFMAVNKFMTEFTGAPNPVFPLMAERTGIALLEPYFRWLTGVLEIIVGVLLIAPRTRVIGAYLGLCILIGALAAHFSPFLGIDIPGVGKFVFYMAIFMTALTIAVLFLSRRPSHDDSVKI